MPFCLMPEFCSILNKKGMDVCFIICHKHQARSGKIKANKAQQIVAKT